METSGLKLVVFDTETSGLDEDSVPVEIAYVELREEAGEWVRENEFLSKINELGEDGVISDGAGGKHQITKEELDGEPRMSEIPWPEGPIIFVSHNTKFDRRFFARYVDIRAELCTFLLSRRFDPESESHKLTTLAYRYGLPVELAHRALGDARSAASILTYYFEETGWSLDQMLKFYNTPFVHKTMMFGKHKGLPMDEVPFGYLGWLSQLDDLDRDMRATVNEYLKRGVR